VETITNFLEMGGYAVYVWPSYLITAVVLIGALVSSIRFLKRNAETLKALQEEDKGEA